MAKLCVVLGDQLSVDMSSLQRICPTKDWVLMAELNEEATYVKHHKKKIAFVFSAMRHFAETLKSNRYQVNYVHFTDNENKGSLFNQVKAFADAHIIDEIIIAHPAEYRLWESVTTWSSKLDLKVTITDDNRFIADKSDFSSWADTRKQLRMEYFYRDMRKKTGVLLESAHAHGTKNKKDKVQPIGGKWNFDSENRAKLPKNHEIPKPSVFAPDQITKDVIALVKRELSHHFGDIDDFHYAVNREQALKVLNEFVEQRLPNFGKYQDAMRQNEPWLYHSHLSLYINTGLLCPLEVIQAAEQAYHCGTAPLNSVEGFIRQVLGWREYVRGFYWYLMPEYKHKNYFNAERHLPEFFWNTDTRMNCMQQSISDTKANAYAHHIQRLMVIGNFALLAGLSPGEVNEWYLLVYADAYEWVELPNVSGMVLFADGGKLASKPYAASGAYINKMSNYCQYCEYSVKEKTGTQACPFNYLYWQFLIKHKEKLQGNPRMAMIYRTLQKMDQTKIDHILSDANTFLLKLDHNEKV